MPFSPACFRLATLLAALMLPSACITESGDPVDELHAVQQREVFLNSIFEENERKEAEKRKADEVLRNAVRRQRRAAIEYRQRQDIAGGEGGGSGGSAH